MLISKFTNFPKSGIRLQFKDIPHAVASAAARFVTVFFAEQHRTAFMYEAVGVRGEVAAVLTNGVYLGDVLCHGKQVRHWPERPPLEVHVQPSDDDPLACQCQLLANLRQLFIKELSFVNSNHIDAFREVEHALGAVNGRRQNEVFIVRNDLHFIISGIYFRFENLDFLVGNLCPFQPADKLLRFAGEHAPANDLNPTVALTFEMWFKKHG